ncbi:hypothetical protein [Nocardia nova]|uniref:hypothetical protein n=1 Tax=Nocardia nova TaxID=37330 RepID=UPI0033F7D7D7
MADPWWKGSLSMRRKVRALNDPRASHTWANLMDETHTAVADLADDGIRTDEIPVLGGGTVLDCTGYDRVSRALPTLRKLESIGFLEIVDEKTASVRLTWSGQTTAKGRIEGAERKAEGRPKKNQKSQLRSGNGSTKSAAKQSNSTPNTDLDATTPPPINPEDWDGDADTDAAGYLKAYDEFVAYERHLKQMTWDALEVNKSRQRDPQIKLAPCLYQKWSNDWRIDWHANRSERSRETDLCLAIEDAVYTLCDELSLSGPDGISFPLILDVDDADEWIARARAKLAAPCPRRPSSTEEEYGGFAEELRARLSDSVVDTETGPAEQHVDESTDEPSEDDWVERLRQRTDLTDVDLAAIIDGVELEAPLGPDRPVALQTQSADELEPDRLLGNI